MDVMMVSNSPYVGSGYGQQTAQLLRRMKRDGHNVALSANYGAQVMMEWEGIPIYAEGMIRYANDSGPENIIKWTRNGVSDSRCLTCGLVSLLSGTRSLSSRGCQSITTQYHRQCLSGASRVVTR